MRTRKHKERLLVYAIKHTKIDTYFSLSEFKIELKRFRAINKLFDSYSNSNTIDVPLLLTHFVILSNIFPIEILNRFLFTEISCHHWQKLKTTLLFLNLLSKQKALRLVTTPLAIIRLNKIIEDKSFLQILENGITNRRIDN